MQDSALEVEFNIIVSDHIKRMTYKGRKREYSRPFASKTTIQKVSLEDMAKKMEEMASELSNLKLKKQRWNAPQEGVAWNANQYSR